jgi:hypothetical protein
LAELPDELVQRRVYMLMIQGEGRAEVRVFERFSLEDAEGTVATWQDESLGNLVTELTEVLLTNKGVHCPGEQVKSTIEADREFSLEGPHPAPKSAGEAFGPMLASFGDDRFVQATLTVLC